MSPSRSVVFFDLDRTLVPFNTAFAYATDEWRSGRLPTPRFLESALWIGLYHLALTDMEGALARAASFYEGVAEEELRQSARTWFEKRVRGALLPLARAHIERHRSEGHHLVLHTSSSCYLAEAAVAAWGLDDFLSNRFPVDASGRLTGAIARPVCYGRGKLTLAKAYAERHGFSLSEAWFYSDSASDAPLLEAVGNPRVVRPDPRLTRMASRRGWPRVDW